MNNLKALREARGLSQQKLGEKFNLTQQSVYKYENQLAEPDLKTLMKLYVLSNHQRIEKKQKTFMAKRDAFWTNKKTSRLSA